MIYSNFCSRHKLPKMIHENSFALESLGLFRVLAQDSIVMTVFCKIAVFCFIFDEVEACKMTIPILHCQAFGLHYAFRRRAHSFCRLLESFHAAFKGCGRFLHHPILLECEKPGTLCRLRTHHCEKRHAKRDFFFLGPLTESALAGEGSARRRVSSHPSEDSTPCRSRSQTNWLWS